MDTKIPSCSFCTQNCKHSIKIADLKPLFQKAIAEHFWFKESELLTFQICAGCSKKVMNFHMFYCTVKQLHAAKDDHPEYEDNANDEVTIKNEPLDPELISGDITNEEQLTVGDFAFEIVEVKAKTEVFEDENELLDEGKCEISETLINKNKTENCTNCDKSFEDKKVLELHMKLVHGDRTAVGNCSLCALLEQALREALEQEVSESSGGVQCAVCNGKLKNVASLQKHLAWHWGEPCSMCGKRLSNYETTKENQIDIPHKNESTSYKTKNKTYVCTNCEKQYTLKNSMKAHMQKCRKFSPGICQQCEALDQALEDLSDRNESGEYGRVKCAVCDVWVIDLASFQRHLAWHQSKPCDGCQRKPRQPVVGQQNVVKTQDQAVSSQAKRPKIEASSTSHAELTN